MYPKYIDQTIIYRQTTCVLCISVISYDELLMIKIYFFRINLNVEIANHSLQYVHTKQDTWLRLTLPLYISTFIIYWYMNRDRQKKDRQLHLTLPLYFYLFYPLVHEQRQTKNRIGSYILPYLYTFNLYCLLVHE